MLGQWLEDIVKETMEFWGIPGLSIAIVRDTQVILSQGFGFRNLEERLPVTPQTIFATGSSTKAFTATAIGILVDRGILTWDCPVRNYLPTFRVFCRNASEEITLRDLVTMRSGLPGYDVIWFGSNGSCPYTKQELYQHLTFMKSTHELRSIFQPQNLLYTVAGMVVGHVSESTWETFVQHEIFDALGMADSNFSVKESQLSDNFAQPYECDENSLKKFVLRDVDAIGPAGSINSTALDMAKWLILNLNSGKYGDRQVIDSETLSKMQMPQFVVNSNTTDFAHFTPHYNNDTIDHARLLTSIQKRHSLRSLLGGTVKAKNEANVDIFYPVSYGLGWLTSAYRGHYLIETSGGIDGFTAMVSLLPNSNLGLVVLTNLNKTMGAKSLTYQIYDRLLDLTPLPWNQIWQQEVEEEKKKTEEKWEKILAGRKPWLKPFHPLDDYLGKFANSSLGSLSITMNEGCMVAVYNDIAYILEPYCHDTFLATLAPYNKITNNGSPYPNPILLSYYTDTNGELSRLSFPLEPALQELIFNRLPNAER